MPASIVTHRDARLAGQSYNVRARLLFLAARCYPATLRRARGLAADGSSAGPGTFGRLR